MLIQYYRSKLILSVFLKNKLQPHLNPRKNVKTRSLLTLTKLMPGIVDGPLCLAQWPEDEWEHLAPAMQRDRCHLSPSAPSEPVSQGLKSQIGCSKWHFCWVMMTKTLHVYQVWEMHAGLVRMGILCWHIITVCNRDVVWEIMGQRYICPLKCIIVTGKCKLLVYLDGSGRCIASVYYQAM